MQDITQTVFLLVVCAGVVGACLWLRRQMHSSGMEKFPFWRLVFLAVTYGGAFWVFFCALASSEFSQKTALGNILQNVGDTVGIYLFVVAPIAVIVVGAASALQRGNSAYHRLVYWGCAGYAIVLLSFFVLLPSRCGTPPGGIP